MARAPRALECGAREGPRAGARAARAAAATAHGRRSGAAAARACGRVGEQAPRGAGLWLCGWSSRCRLCLCRVMCGDAVSFRVQAGLSREPVLPPRPLALAGGCSGRRVVCLCLLPGLPLAARARARPRARRPPRATPAPHAPHACRSIAAPAVAGRRGCAPSAPPAAAAALTGDAGAKSEGI